MEPELNIEDEKVKKELNAELQEILGPGFASTTRPDKREESPHALRWRASGQPDAMPWLVPAQLTLFIVVFVVLAGLYWKTTPIGSTSPPVVPSRTKATDPGIRSSGPVGRTVPHPPPPHKTVAERKEQLYNHLAADFRLGRWRTDTATRKRVLQRIDNLERLGKQTHDKEAIDLAKAARDRINTASVLK